MRPAKPGNSRMDTNTPEIVVARRRRSESRARPRLDLLRSSGMVSRDTRLPWVMLSLFQYTFRTRAWPTWARYAATCAIVVTTLLVRLALQAQFPGSPFLLFMLAVILCSALFDHGCGILSGLQTPHSATARGHAAS